MWPKLIVNETNEILKSFLFFFKKNDIFSNFENLLKKTTSGAAFFERLIHLQNCFESLQNEILNFFHFFKKKSTFFQILKIPWKNSSRSCFFLKSWVSWLNFKTTQNRFKTFSEVTEGIIGKVSDGFTLYDFETLNATISLYARSSHVEAKKGYF